jgi:hypothetical protein
MTPDKKCEHRDKEGDMDLGWTDAGEVSCLTCGQRFVPSDVLEEARAVIVDLHARLGHFPPREEEEQAREGARATLRRIDEVLGLNSPR